MTVVGRTWDRLTLPGKILAVVIPLGAILTAGLAILIALLGAAVVQFLVDNLPLVRFIVAATIVLLMTVPTAFLIIYMEMKVIALMNLRYRPRSGRSVRLGAVGGPRAEGPDEGGLHSDRGGRAGLHPAPRSWSTWPA